MATEEFKFFIEETPVGDMTSTELEEEKEFLYLSLQEVQSVEYRVRVRLREISNEINRRMTRHITTHGPNDPTPR